jgi:hypothetical protein
MTNDEKVHLADELLNYCKKFNVPLEFLFRILEDQKVTPMIRGKAMEFNTYLLLAAFLPNSTWSVQKLNLNAQSGGIGDEDVSITHLRTGTILKVECKSCVRGSISTGKKSRNIRVPHFHVKCHRSRSNIKLAGTSNDRYSVDTFDVLITNTSNAIFEGATVSEMLEVIHDTETKNMLYWFYDVTSDEQLVSKCEQDWRFCIPTDIAENGFIPRTPAVLLSNDPNWKPIAEIETRLMDIVNEKRNAAKAKATRRK